MRKILHRREDVPESFRARGEVSRTTYPVDAWLKEAETRGYERGRKDGYGEGYAAAVQGFKDRFPVIQDELAEERT